MEPLIEDFITSIRQMQSYKKQIVHVEKIPAKDAIFGELNNPLPKNIQKCLLDRKITFDAFLRVKQKQ